jgi:myo-inositol-1(or 4)-monophosphatase
MINPSLNEIGELARVAGKITLKYFRNHARFTEKEDYKGVVTEADLESESFIKSFIKEKFPSHSILAEESGFDDHSKSGEKSSNSSVGQPLWLIDPLDGTNNFSKGLPHYCVSIGYGIQKGDRCEMLMGVVYHPVADDLYMAEKGRGAFCNGKPMRVSSEADFAKGSYSTGIGANRGDSLKKIFDSMYRVQMDCSSTALRINGAAALDLSYVARGLSHGFWEPKLNAWDTAAGSLLVSEAGGKVSNERGEEFDPLRDPFVVASTSLLHSRFLGLVGLS